MFTTLRHPLVALLAAAALALSAAGCGDSDDGDDSRADTSGDRMPDFGAPDSDEEREVGAAVEDLYADLADADADAVCEQLTPSGREQFGLGREAACVTGIEQLLEGSERSGALERLGQMRIGDVEIDGDEAIVTVSFGAQGGRLPLREDDGRWLAGTLTLPSAAPAEGKRRRK